MELPGKMANLGLNDQSKQDKEQQRFEFGLDYGATYSAAVFSLKSGSRNGYLTGEIYPIRGYSSGMNQSSKSKCTEIPSDIRYESKNVILIGYDVTRPIRDRGPGSDVRRAKLGLVEREETAAVRNEVLSILPKLPVKRSLEGVIIDYLTEMFGFCKKQLELAGYCSSRDVIELNSTVPSVWDHHARLTMFQALLLAGEKSGLVFDPREVRLWPEAEAATHFVLDKSELWYPV